MHNWHPSNSRLSSADGIVDSHIVYASEERKEYFKRMKREVRPSEISWYNVGTPSSEILILSVGHFGINEKREKYN